MVSQLALGLAIVLIVWLYRRDIQLRKLPSPALWIPAVWLAIVGSRGAGYWLSTLGLTSGSSRSNLEGSPVDQVVFLGLMLGAVVTLARRSFDWATFVSGNKTLIAIYLYFALSALWSEHPEPTLKRALKDFGHVLLALVLLTETDPMKAIRIVFVRVSYLLFPLSVLFIKFFPKIGRVSDRSGSNLFTGVTEHKNSLGCIVFVFGVFLFIDLMEIRKRRDPNQKQHKWIRYGMLATGVWLLLTCNSLTSMISLTLGCFFLWGMERMLQKRNPKRILYRILAAISIMAILQFSFNITGIISEAFGRGSGFSGRTEIWEMVKQANTDPIIGCGFYSFWNTTEAQAISELFKGTLTTVHNGLLETYLDTGVIGLALLLLLLLVWGRKSIRLMLEGTLRGRLTLCIFFLALLNNFSETHYFRFTPLWFTLLLLMLECPPSRHPMATAVEVRQ